MELAMALLVEVGSKMRSGGCSPETVAQQQVCVCARVSACVLVCVLSRLHVLHVLQHVAVVLCGVLRPWLLLLMHMRCSVL